MLVYQRVSQARNVSAIVHPSTLHFRSVLPQLQVSQRAPKLSGESKEIPKWHGT